MDIVKVGESIEGLMIDGHSRDPLIAGKGLVRCNNIVCYRYVAEFNVKAHIHKRIEDEETKLLKPTAIKDVNARIVCENAIIHTLKDKYTKNVGSNISATHSSNVWHFPTQTNVEITRSHQAIANGIFKRESKKLRG